MLLHTQCLLLVLLLLFGWFWWGCVYPHATVVVELEGGRELFTLTYNHPAALDSCP